MPFNLYKAYILAFVASSPCLTAPVAKTIDANFDDIPTVVGDPNLNSISTYKGLLYSNWNPDRAGDELAPAYIPHSKPNVNSFGGTAIDVTSEGVHSISSNSTGSTVGSFSALSFFWGGFATSQESEVQVARSTTLTVTGYYRGKKLGTAMFSGVPTGLVDNQMFSAQLPQSTFQKVDFLAFSATQDLTGNLDAGIKVDDFDFIPRSN
ncbi:MAG: hypothetical protein M1828_006070 [Chrysothrix sp. TS-e1954]|nr:MAG: hypothetical protein M1828_006070 [Chrysothrix sp. TS-e1954]